MKDYTITIKKDNKTICTVGGNNMEYDNIIWWQLEKLVDIVSKDFNNVDNLVSAIEEGTEYLGLTNNGGRAVIDLDSKTIDMPLFPLYKIEDVCPEECCISLKRKNGNYYAVYDNGEEYLMDEITFEDCDLLQRKNVTFNEFKKICKFINKLLDTNGTDFILNSKNIVRFNCI